MNSDLCFHDNGIGKVSNCLFMKTLPTCNGKSNMAVPWQLEASRADTSDRGGRRWASACATRTRGPMWDGAGRTVPSDPVRSSKRHLKTRKTQVEMRSSPGQSNYSWAHERPCAIIHSCSDRMVKMKSQPDQKICTCKPHPRHTWGM